MNIENLTVILSHVIYFFPSAVKATTKNVSQKSLGLRDRLIMPLFFKLTLNMVTLESLFIPFPNDVPFVKDHAFAR